MRAQAVSALVALSALLGCGPDAVSTADAGAISGIVRLGPIMPVCQVNVPCDGVYKGARVVVRAPGGRVIGRATADQNGAFSLSVPAGTYEASVEVEGMLPSCTPASVSVSAREAARVEIDCDSGIR